MTHSALISNRSALSQKRQVEFGSDNGGHVTLSSLEWWNSGWNFGRNGMNNGVKALV